MTSTATKRKDIGFMESENEFIIDWNDTYHKNLIVDCLYKKGIISKEIADRTKRILADKHVERQRYL